MLFRSGKIKSGKDNVVIIRVKVGMSAVDAKISSRTAYKNIIVATACDSEIIECKIPDSVFFIVRIAKIFVIVGSMVFNHIDVSDAMIGGNPYIFINIFLNGADIVV